jgi:hypothetical protein
MYDVGCCLKGVQWIQCLNGGAVCPLSSHWLDQGWWYACIKWHAERFPWHATFTAIPIFYFFYPTSVSILWRICVYTHISDCVQTVYTHIHLAVYRLYIHTYIWLCTDCIYTHKSDCWEIVYELPLVPNTTAVKHFYANQERCATLTGYLPLWRRPCGDLANTWHWTDRFTVCFFIREI